MNELTLTRPVPVPDEASAPFWEAAARHELHLPRCASCRELSVPPDVTCPRCGTTEPAWAYERITGSGRVRSWTVVRQSFLPGFDDDLPFVLVDVELDEQADLRLIGRLIERPSADASPPSLGDRVTLAFEDVRPGVSVPAFAPAP